MLKTYKCCDLRPSMHGRMRGEDGKEYEFSVCIYHFRKGLRKQLGFRKYWTMRITSIAKDTVFPACGTACCGQRSLFLWIRCPNCRLLKNSKILHHRRSPSSRLRFVFSSWWHDRRMDKIMEQNGIRKFPSQTLKSRLILWWKILYNGK